MGEDNTREGFPGGFFPLNKVSSNKGGDPKKGNPEQVQLNRLDAISRFTMLSGNSQKRSDQLPELGEVHSK